MNVRRAFLRSINSAILVHRDELVSLEKQTNQLVKGWFVEKESEHLAN
jgi:hypothetical protein